MDGWVKAVHREGPHRLEETPDDNAKWEVVDGTSWTQKAAELKQFDRLPLTKIRRGLENKAPGCVCKQALAILEGER